MRAITPFTVMVVFWTCCLAIHANGQTKAECLAIMKKADAAINDRNYNFALTKLRAYKICSPGSAKEADEKILLVFNRIEAEKKSADSARQVAVNQTNIAIQERNRALRKAESNRLLSLALQKASTNPTVAVRLAERSLEIDKENGSASTVMENIFSNNKTCYYSKVLRVTDGEIQDIDFSPDGKYILAASSGMLSLWTVAGVKVNSLKIDNSIAYAKFIPHAADYEFVAISGSGKFFRFDREFQQKFAIQIGYFKLEAGVQFVGPLCVVGCTGDNVVKMVHVETGDIRSIKIPTTAMTYNRPQVRFSGSKIALLYDLQMNIERAVYLYDTLTKKLDKLGEDQLYQSIYFQKSTGYLLVSLSNGGMLAFDAAGRPVERENSPEHSRGFFKRSYFITDHVQVAFAENEEMVEVKQYDAALPFSKQLRNDTIFTFAYNSVNNICITGNYKGEIRFWPLHGLNVKRFANKSQNFATELNISKTDNSMMAYIQQDKIAIWRNELESELLSDIPGVLQTACFHPNGKSILVGVAYKRFEGLIGEVPYGTPTLNEYTLSGKHIKAFKVFEDISAITASDDGKIIVSGHTDGRIRISKGDGILFDSLDFGHGRVTSLAISPNKNWLAFALEGQEKAILYNIKSKRSIIFKSAFIFGPYISLITKVFFSRDGQYVYTGDDFYGLEKFRINGKKIMSFVDNVVSTSKGVLSFDLSRDDKYLVITRKPVSSGSTVSYVNVIDARSGRLIQTITSEEKSDRIWNATFSSDSKYIFTVHSDNSIRKWYTIQAFLHSKDLADLRQEDKRTYGIHDSITAKKY